MKKFTPKTVALIVVLVALAVGAWLMFGRTAAGIGYPDEDKYTVGNASVSGEVNNLFVDWTAGKVTVEYYGGSEIKVEETANRTLSDDDKLRWWLDGDTLRVRYAKSGFRVSFNLDKQLTVSLPRDLALKSADISCTSGDLNIPALKAEDIRLDTTSGNIDAGTDAKTITADSTSGSVKVHQESPLDSVKMDSTSGTIYPDFASVDKAEFSSTSGGVVGTVVSFKSLKASSTSGSIDLKVGTDSGFTLKADSTSGKVDISLSDVTVSGDTVVVGDGSGSCDLDTTSGNIRVSKAE